MSIECPECGERVDALPIHKCRKGGDILKELAELRDWHINEDSKVKEHDHLNRKLRVHHMKSAYLIDAARVQIMRQDEIIAQNAEPFTDPNRENKHSR